MLAPGGRIVLIGQDWEMVAIDSDDPGLTRTIVHARAELVTEARVGGWAEEQQRRAHDDRLFLAVPVFVASATR